MAATTRAIVRNERSHAIGSAAANVQLFHCRLDERFLTFENDRQRKIGSGLEQRESVEGARVPRMITPHQSTRAPPCQRLRTQAVVQNIDCRASPRTASS